MRYAPWTVLLMLPLVACVSTNAAVLDPTVKYQKICPDGVQIFTTAEHISSDYREVALLHSKGESGWTTERGMMSSQRQKAATLGANGIVLNNIKEPNAGTKIIGALLGTGSERQGAAVAIYIPADSVRVMQACGLAPKENQVAASRALIRGGSAQTVTTAAPDRVAVAPDPAPPAPSGATVTSGASQPEEPLPAGYAGYATTDPPTTHALPHATTAGRPVTPPSAGAVSAARFNGELRRFGSLRQALDDVVRLRIVTEYQEVHRSVLKLMLGSGYDGRAVEYNLRRLWSAYGQTLDPDQSGIIELWHDGQKLGEYTFEGLLVGPEYGAPR